MQIIITGATGFVGRNLTDYLSESTFSVSRLNLRMEGWQNEFPQKGDAVIHLAGKAHDTSNVSGAEAYFAINSDLTKQVFDLFLTSEIRDFFYFSSVKAVADTVTGVLFEDASASPLTPYGQSKREAENYLLSKALPKGKRLFIIRPCMIHGPGNKGNLNLLFNLVKKGIPWPLGAFENERSFLGIDNLCFMIKAMLMKGDIKSGIYNFSDDAVLSTNGLINIISEVLGKKTRIWNISNSLIILLAKVGDKIYLPLNSERLKKLTESYIVSNRKIKRELGIDELPFSVKEGLTKTIQSFK